MSRRGEVTQDSADLGKSRRLRQARGEHTLARRHVCRRACACASGNSWGYVVGKGLMAVAIVRATASAQDH